MAGSGPCARKIGRARRLPGAVDCWGFAAGVTAPELAGPTTARWSETGIGGDALGNHWPRAGAFRALVGLDFTAKRNASFGTSTCGPEGESTVTVAAQLALAAGWYAAGHEDEGDRILKHARNLLYLGGKLSDADRTNLALAYAEVLGFAPPRIAHGLLEELFQRLGTVKIEGATNRYFTLRPLQLIDTVVRAVVTDEFALGPSVRGWLDDDEFLIRGRIHRDLAAVLREQGIA